MVFYRMRRLLGLKPPYFQARQKLRAALNSGVLRESDPIETSGAAIDKACGWDSWFDGADWVELEMEAEAMNIKVKTVANFLKLLETIDSRYEG